MLAGYEPRSATNAWFETLRAVEECINLVTVERDDDGFDHVLFSLPIAGLGKSLDQLGAVQARIVKRFGKDFAARFVRLLAQSSHLAR